MIQEELESIQHDLGILIVDIQGAEKVIADPNEPAEFKRFIGQRAVTFLTRFVDRFTALRDNVQSTLG